MGLERITVDIASNAAGDTVTAYTRIPITGKILAVFYDFGDLAANLDLAITGETTGIPILAYTNIPAADKWFYPRALPNLNTAGATVGVDAFVEIPVVDERIKIVAAQPGTSKAGAFTIFYER